MLSRRIAMLNCGRGTPAFRGLATPSVAPLPPHPPPLPLLPVMLSHFSCFSPFFSLSALPSYSLVVVVVVYSLHSSLSTSFSFSSSTSTFRVQTRLPHPPSSSVLWASLYVFISPLSHVSSRLSKPSFLCVSYTPSLPPLPPPLSLTQPRVQRAYIYHLMLLLFFVPLYFTSMFSVVDPQLFYPMKQVTFPGKCVNL